MGSRLPAACALAILWANARAQVPLAPFEVVSVKVHANAADTNMSIGTPPGGQLSCSNANLRALIAYAYDVRDYQILNTPAWAETDRYDIAAKLSEQDAAQEP